MYYPFRQDIIENKTDVITNRSQERSPDQGFRPRLHANNTKKNGVAHVTYLLLSHFPLLLCVFWRNSENLNTPLERLENSIQFQAEEQRRESLAGGLSTGLGTKSGPSTYASTRHKHMECRHKYAAATCKHFVSRPHSALHFQIGPVDFQPKFTPALQKTRAKTKYI